MINHHASIVVLAIAAPLLAQTQSTTAVVTPQGLFYQHATGSGGSATATAADSPQGLRWTYAQPTAITEKVSVGNHGTLAWLAQNLNNERYSLLATTETDPPTFISEVSQLNADWLRVKAADKGQFAVTATKSSGIVTLDFWSCYSTTPIWTTTFAFDVLIDISESGQFVAVGYSPTTSSSQVDVYDAFGTGFTTPIATMTAGSHSLRQMDLSDDGSTLLIATNTQNHIFDVATQAQVMQASTVSHDAHAISRDGTAWGRGGFNPITAYVKSGGAYNQVLNFSDNVLGFAVYSAAGISNDGTTFAAAAYDALNTGVIRVCCWDLTPTGSTLLWSYTSTVIGTLQSTPQAVSISDDGSIIAVGSWGDQFNTYPEVMIFDRNGTGTPMASIDTPGSCFDLDLSGDGQFLVVGTKSVHANTFGNGGEGYSFDLGGQDFWLEGTPSIGRSFTLSTEAAAGEAVFIGFAGGLGAPMSLPGISGTLQLDLGTYLGTVFAGVSPAGGVQVFNLSLPNVPSLVGHEFAVQAMHGAPFAFTNPLRLPITQ